jgi:hypothetical protein
MKILGQLGKSRGAGEVGIGNLGQAKFGHCEHPLAIYLVVFLAVSLAVSLAIFLPIELVSV